MLGFSNALRLELKPLGVAVTTVNPGPIQTEFFDKADPTGTYLAAVDKIVLDPTKLAKEVVGSMGTFDVRLIVHLSSAAALYIAHLGEIS